MTHIIYQFPTLEHAVCIKPPSRPTPERFLVTRYADHGLVNDHKHGDVVTVKLLLRWSIGKWVALWSPQKPNDLYLTRRTLWGT